ncbi:MAG: hypothetical protein C4530_01935 [Desulfobacteraceae bacterium]|nr:MAG: hypothetical protein C4530_01935 [Desulfobacteraceae bacterium]
MFTGASPDPSGSGLPLGRFFGRSIRFVRYAENGHASCGSNELSHVDYRRVWDHWKKRPSIGASGDRRFRFCNRHRQIFCRSSCNAR